MSQFLGNSKSFLVLSFFLMVFFFYFVVYIQPCLIFILNCRDMLQTFEVDAIFFCRENPYKPN